jgi:hypothetical protein
MANKKEMQKVGEAFTVLLDDWFTPMQREAGMDVSDKEKGFVAKETKAGEPGTVGAPVGKDDPEKKVLVDNQPTATASAPTTGAQGVENAAAPCAPAASGKKVSTKKEGDELQKNAARLEKLASALTTVLDEGAPKVEKVATIEKTATEKEADEAAGMFREWYLKGREQRLQDEKELKEANINPEFLKQHGVNSIEEWLDKAAAVDPTAVLPPELAAAADAQGAGAAGGEVDPNQVLDQLAEILAQSGVQPEELQQLLQEIVSLKQQGYSDEEIMQSLAELADEAGAGGAEGAAPAEAPAMPEAAPVPEAEKTAEEVRSRIDTIKGTIKAMGSK